MCQVLLELKIHGGRKTAKYTGGLENGPVTMMVIVRRKEGDLTEEGGTL